MRAHELSSLDIRDRPAPKKLLPAWWIDVKNLIGEPTLASPSFFPSRLPVNDLRVIDFVLAMQETFTLTQIMTWLIGWDDALTYRLHKIMWH